MDKDREIEIENRLTDSERRHKISEKRIDKLENQYDLISDMNANIKVLVEQNCNQTKAIENVQSDLGTFKNEVKSDMSSIKKDIDEVKGTPDKKDADKWDKLKWIIISFFVGGGLTLVWNSFLSK